LLRTFPARSERIFNVRDAKDAPAGSKLHRTLSPPRAPRLACQCRWRGLGRQRRSIGDLVACLAALASMLLRLVVPRAAGSGSLALRDSARNQVREPEAAKIAKKKKR
jgi:hypothetical protein